MTRSRDVASNGGLVLVNTSAVTSGASTFSINNVFTSTYKNYKVIIDNLEGSAVAGIWLRVRANGTDLTSSNYQYQWIRVSSTTFTGFRGSDTQGRLSSTGSSGDKSSIVFDILNPQVSTWTNIISQALFTWTGTGASSESSTVLINNTNQYDGFTIYPDGGTFTTGNIKIYGYK